VRTAAAALAEWAVRLEPSEEDLALARRALLDTVAVALAAREDPIRGLLREEDEVARWAALAHVLDFDDLHLPSTAHISAVCVPATLAAGGDARAYLAGAGVMARLGAALGWAHYSAGWHATCTAGTLAAAVSAGTALGLDDERTAAAIALAVPAAGGVQRAFGTAAKSLQVAGAAAAGLRAARLAAAGASADPGALEQWMELVGGDPSAIRLEGEAVPGGLAVKIFPCCYALQRPIAAMLELPSVRGEQVRRVNVRTPGSSLTPLIHHRPKTGLEGKFSLEYAIAATILDRPPGAASFTDAAVARPQAGRLMELVEVRAVDVDPPLQGLLAGEVEIEIALDDGEAHRVSLSLPPGAPGRPPSDVDLMVKLRSCAGDLAQELRELDWASAADYLRREIPLR